MLNANCKLTAVLVTGLDQQQNESTTELNSSRDDVSDNAAAAAAADDDDDDDGDSDNDYERSLAGYSPARCLFHLCQ